MGARQSAATDKALRLVERGYTVAQAARKAGVSWVTVYRAQQRAGTRKTPKRP